MPDLVRDIRLLKQARLEQKTEKKLEQARKWAVLCYEIDGRDRYRCRACGCKVMRTLAAVPNRLERHHVIPISLGGENTAENVVSLCLECHFARHVMRTLLLDGNANKSLTCTRLNREGDVLRVWKSQPPGAQP